jgi:hypothetical protein
MEYVISISDNSRYIIIKVSGEMNGQIAMKYTEESHELAAVKGLDKFLVDLTDATNTLRVIENYEFAYDTVSASPKINKLAKVALLVAKDDHSHDFVETVSINAGLLVRLFRNHKAALEYLGV